MTYKEKLKDPRWQQKRLKIFERDDWKCTKCGVNSNELHVHHKKYIRGLEPWDYENNYLETLCSNCHNNEHFELLIDTSGKYEHLISEQKSPDVISSIDNQIKELELKLRDKNIEYSIQEEILKNLMYLREKRKEYKNG